MAHKQHQRKNDQGSRRKQYKKTQQFSTDSVLSPQNCSFVTRTTIQRTPRKLCTLTLPPPLPSLFEDPTSKDAAEATTIPNRRHHRTPSDFTGISIDPSLMTESSHYTRHHHTSESPAHLRIGMACDPLIAYGYVLVATTDGRVAIYQTVDWESEVDDDVLASEERRRKEWEEEDAECASNNEEDEEKKSMEESFWEEDDVMERMSAREKARECVDPLMVVSLPNISGVEMKESSLSLSLPMIVGMCATSLATSLIQHRGDNAEKPNNERLLGHVTVLTDDGGVHILELLSNQFLSSDSEIAEAAIKMLNYDKDVASLHQFAPIVNVVFSFHTGSLGASCICVQPIICGHDKLQHAEPDRATSQKIEGEHIERKYEDTRHASNMRLCIGHEGGILECYQIFSTLAPANEGTKSTSHCNLSVPYPMAKSKSNEIPRSGSNSNLSRGTSKRIMNTSFSSGNLSVNPEEEGTEDSFDLASVSTPTRLNRTLSEPTDQLLLKQQPNSGAKMTHTINAELCWRGSMNVPIRCVACRGSLANNKSSCLVALGLMQRQKESNLMDTNRKCSYQEMSPAVSLDVFDATMAEEHWSRMKEERAETNSTAADNRYEGIISLNQCSIWPAAGMEFRDGWTRSDGRYCHETVSQALGLRSVSITNKICHFASGSPCFASAASDGTVAISHFNEDGTWGIHHNYNQLMLPQRCIGMGAFETPSTKPERHICCCLRGGTMYLVPVLEKEDAAAASAREITKFLAPVDPSGFDDNIVRYVQNFAAGVIQTVQRSTNHATITDSSLKSVALVGWNGGILDVYEVDTGENRYDKELIQQIVKRGLANRLLEKLLIVNRNHPMMASALWVEAWDECNRVKNVDSILAGIAHTNFAATRALLKSLAEDRT